MHELAVTESLLELAIRHGEQAGARRITALHLVIGALSSIVDESVQLYWDIVSRGTIAEGAILRFRRTTAVVTCHDCGGGFDAPTRDTLCPGCGGARLSMAGGDEFSLEALDIEPQDDEAESEAPTSGGGCVAAVVAGGRTAS